MGFYIDMIDVGEGDAFLLTIDTPSGECYVLIDAGRPDKGETVRKFVQQYAGGHLHAAIVTHLDEDHVGGMQAVVEGCTVDALYMNLPPNARIAALELYTSRVLKNQKTGTYWRMLEKSLDTAAALADALVPKPITAGRTFAYGDVVLKVLSPNEGLVKAAWDEIEQDESPVAGVLDALAKLYEAVGIEQTPATSAENNASVVIELIYRDEPYALFSGDAGADVLTEVTAGRSYPFLKVPHHGSKTGMDDALIAQLNPTSAYIPVGENQHGHPCIEVLDMLRAQGARTFCSEKTKGCRKDCPVGGFGNLCHRKDKPFRLDWRSVDDSKCINNRPVTADS